MNNPNNILITKGKVEDILNYFGNIGDNYQRLEINNLEYFQRAFVHESYYQAIQNAVINKQIKEETTYLSYIPEQSNERLEFLGDHVLKSVMARYLVERFGEEREGFLTRLKIKIEKCSMLHKFGVILGFKDYLLLSLQVENTTILDVERGRGTPSYYEDAFEAFIGSIMMDFGEKGYIYADRFTRSVIENIIDFSELISKNDNYKDSIQRYYQKYHFKPPTYITIDEDGPLYRKVFTRAILISNEQLMLIEDKEIVKNIKELNDKAKVQMKIEIENGKYILSVGKGRKVVNAEQEAAKKALEILLLDQNY